MPIPSILRDNLPADTDLDACTITTYGALSAEHRVDFDGYYYMGDIPDSAPVVMLPGWSADDGNARVEYPDAETGEQAAQDYVDEGDWGQSNETSWVSVSAWRTGYVLSDAEAEEVLCLQIDLMRHTTEIAPDEPQCEDGREHDWRSPYDVVGGIEENPGVYGHGGGVIITEVCTHCGAYRVTDTWAQDMATGEQGLTSVEYREADELSLEWIRDALDA